MKKTDKELLVILKGILKEYGEDLSMSVYDQITKNGNYPSSKTYERRFGWNRAKELALPKPKKQKNTKPHPSEKKIKHLLIDGILKDL